ncbi:MAG: HAMP domain-containing sensor histidine kinase [Pseudomonadota bacterium]
MKDHLAGVTHDLRNVMSTLSLTAESIAGAADTDTARKGERLMRMIDVAEDLCQVLNDPDLADRATTPTTTLRETLDAVLAMVDSERVTCVVAEEPAGITTQPARLCHRRLFRVLFNLVHNACGATDTDECQVTVTMRGAGQDLLIDVEDSGPGLPELMVMRLRKPVRISDIGKTGRGLMVVRALTRQMGGQVLLRKTSTDGTCIRLVFPGAL